MGEVTKTCAVKVAELVPYARNAKTHSPEQVEKIAASIKEFGFVSPCLIDKEKNIIAGHGRVMAAQALGLETVPCTFVEGLTDDQRRAYILADNRLTELGGWDMKIVFDELEEIGLTDFDVEITGFDLGTGNNEWFETRERSDTSRQEGNEEYNEFLEKFELAKTTDDCYTPDVVYDAVADWVSAEYGEKREHFVRPFYPGGDYQNEKYSKDAVVVDNPPFSILSEIIRFYSENGIRFFLFAPTLTLFSSAASGNYTAISVGVSVTYENGAKVNTSFVTNLEDKSIRARTAPTLYAKAQEAADTYSKEPTKELPKYTYPPQVVTSSMLAQLSKYGVAYSLSKAESVRINALEAMKEEGKTIYGKGFLVSERAAAEKAEAERAAAEKAEAEKEQKIKEQKIKEWRLSEKEIEIINELGQRVRP